MIWLQLLKLATKILILTVDKWVDFKDFRINCRLLTSVSITEQRLLDFNHIDLLITPLRLLGGSNASLSTLFDSSVVKDRLLSTAQILFNLDRQIVGFAP